MAELTIEQQSTRSSQESFNKVIQLPDEGSIVSPLTLVTSVVSFSMMNFIFKSDDLSMKLKKAFEDGEYAGLSPPMSVIGVASNYGNANRNGYIDIKKKGIVSNRGRKKIVIEEKTAVTRKRPGTGEQFNSQITLPIETRKGQIPLKPKIFETGLVNVPGVKNYDDCIQIAKILVETFQPLYPNICYGNDIRMITANYKFRVNKDGWIFNIPELFARFTAMKNANNTELKIFKVYYSTDGTAVKIDFETPIEGKESQTTKVPFYKRLKINFKGCPSVFYAKKLYDFAMKFIADNPDIYIKVIRADDIVTVRELMLDNNGNIRKSVLDKRNTVPVIEYVLRKIGVDDLGVIHQKDAVKKILMLNYDELMAVLV